MLRRSVWVTGGPLRERRRCTYTFAITSPASASLTPSTTPTFTFCGARVIRRWTRICGAYARSRLEFSTAPNRGPSDSQSTAASWCGCSRSRVATCSANPHSEDFAPVFRFQVALSGEGVGGARGRRRRRGMGGGRAGAGGREAVRRVSDRVEKREHAAFKNHEVVRGLPANSRVWSACVDIHPSVAWLSSHTSASAGQRFARPHAFCIAYRRHGASPSIPRVHHGVCRALMCTSSIYPQQLGARATRSSPTLPAHCRAHLPSDHRARGQDGCKALLKQL